MPKNSALEVFAGTRRAGALSRSEREADSFLFDYTDDCPAADAISLLMPVVRDQYVATGGLLPVFEMNLPEGSLRDELVRRFSKAVRGFDDFAMLAIVGPHQLGRVGIANAQNANDRPPETSLAELLVHHPHIHSGQGVGVAHGRHAQQIGW